MSGHTPGPWKYFYDTEEVVAESGSVGRFEPASGPLAAAAPDLLAALEDFLADFDTWELADHPEGIPVMEPDFADIVDNARAAVKKARGET